ncbi:MAG TPA: OadG-related small transporter subunit [Bacteroidales bacterium]|nr:OadG-related small transporter subunit [Bacteroidales bacterium]
MIDYNIVNSALLISGIGLVGIFVFMMIFYVVIKLIDKFFPAK